MNTQPQQLCCMVIKQATGWDQRTIEPKYNLIRFKLHLFFFSSHDIVSRVLNKKKGTCLPWQQASSHTAAEGGDARQPGTDTGPSSDNLILICSILDFHQEGVVSPAQPFLNINNARTVRTNCASRSQNKAFGLTQDWAVYTVAL